LINSNL
jgi:hypothetical protein